MSEARNFEMLGREIRKQMDLEDDKECLEAQLSIVSKALNNQATIACPTAMTVAGVSEWTTDDGAKVKKAPFVTGSIPKATEEDPKAPHRAFDTLDKYGEGSLIKHEIILTFGKDEQKEALVALNAIRKLRENRWASKISVKYGIHHSSLKAALKRCLTKKGFPLTTTFAGSAGQKVKITRAKPSA